DGETAALVVGYDITELQEAQQHALRAERLAAIGATVAGLAHESRNALQRAQACLVRLSWQLEDRPEALDLVARIGPAPNELLLDDVRNYAAPIKLDPRRCHLTDLFRDAWGQLASLRQGRDARLAGPDGESYWVCVADPFRLTQVFRNILENSLAACADPVRV